MSAGTVTGSSVISSPTVGVGPRRHLAHLSIRRGARRQLVARRRDQGRDRRGHVDHPVIGVGDRARRLASTTRLPRLPKNRSSSGPDGRQQRRRARGRPARRTASGAGTRRRGRSPCSRWTRSARGACLRARPAVSRAASRMPPVEDRPARLDRDRRPDRRRIGQRRLDEDRAAVGQAAERIALAERRHVVERHEVDVLELPVLADPLRGQGQVVGRRQALLLRAVARIGLDVQPEQVADERGDELVGRDRSEAADRVAAQAEGARGSQVERLALEGQRMADARGSRSAARPGRGGRPASRRRPRGRRGRRRAIRGPADTERTRGTSAPSAAWS